MSEKRTFYNDSKSWAAGQQKAFVVKNQVEINIDKPACQLQRQKNNSLKTVRIKRFLRKHVVVMIGLEVIIED